MRRFILLLYTLVIIISLSACRDNLGALTNDIQSNGAYSICSERFEKLDIISATKVVVEYPQISGIDDIKLQDKINRTLADAALFLYSSEESDIGLDMTISYDTMLLTDKVLCIRLKGFYVRNEASHGYPVKYAVNVNMVNGELIKLDELYTELLSDALNLDLFVYKIEDDETDPNSFAYAFEHADKESISRIFEQFTSCAEWSSHVNDFYLEKDGLTIIITISDGSGACLEFKAYYDKLKSYEKS
ncbi:hypothetical protein [Lacrimispora sp.]|uniref:hypothetical protein n=1 Tax=Lacrimispora sp. TaxID=2719234 RepID=UPI00289DF4CA|nr:hypothetical protein [Lacrimispora sp.]